MPVLNLLQKYITMELNAKTFMYNLILHYLPAAMHIFNILIRYVAVFLNRKKLNCCLIESCDFLKACVFGWLKIVLEKLKCGIFPFLHLS